MLLINELTDLCRFPLQYLRQEVHTQWLTQRGLDAHRLATDTCRDKVTWAATAKYCPANHWQLTKYNAAWNTSQMFATWQDIPLNSKWSATRFGAETQNYPIMTRHVFHLSRYHAPYSTAYMCALPNMQSNHLRPCKGSRQLANSTRSDQHVATVSTCKILITLLVAWVKYSNLSLSPVAQPESSTLFTIRLVTGYEQNPIPLQINFNCNIHTRALSRFHTECVKGMPFGACHGCMPLTVLTCASVVVQLVIRVGRNHLRYCMRHFRQTHASYLCAKRTQKRTSVDIANAIHAITSWNSHFPGSSVTKILHTSASWANGAYSGVRLWHCQWLRTAKSRHVQRQVTGMLAEIPQTVQRLAMSCAVRG